MSLSYASVTWVMQVCLYKEPEQLPSTDELADFLRLILCKAVKPGFLGRVRGTSHVADPDEVRLPIIRLKPERMRDRVARRLWGNALLKGCALYGPFVFWSMTI